MNKTTRISLNVLHIILIYASSSEVGVKRYKCLDERNVSLPYTYACSSISLKTHYNPCAYCFTMAKTGEKYQLILDLRITETKERG